MAERGRGLTTWVGFVVGEVNYALNILSVREIIRPLAMETLPHSPETVIGVVDHRGHVVPVVDLRIRFATDSSKRADRHDARWVIASHGERLVGLVVDRVTEVFTLNETDARPVPDLGTNTDRRGITAAYSRGGKLVFTLDLERITQTDEGTLLALPMSLTAEAS